MSLATVLLVQGGYGADSRPLTDREFERIADDWASFEIQASRVGGKKEMAVSGGPSTTRTIEQIDLFDDGGVLINSASDPRDASKRNSAAWILNEHYVASLRSTSWKPKHGLSLASNAKWQLVFMHFRGETNLEPFEKARKLMRSPNLGLLGLGVKVQETFPKKASDVTVLDESPDRLTLSWKSVSGDGTNEKSRTFSMQLDRGVFHVISHLDQVSQFAQGKEIISVDNRYEMTNGVPVLIEQISRQEMIAPDGRKMSATAEQTFDLEFGTEQRANDFARLTHFGIPEPNYRPPGQSRITYAVVIGLAIASLATGFWLRRWKLQV